MGFGYSRNAAEDICIKCGYDPNMPYIFLYCSLFKPHMPVKSKKQARYFGEPYLSTIDFDWIEKFVEELKEHDFPLQDSKFRKRLKELLDNKFLGWGLWTYSLLADTVISILSGETDIETVRESVHLMPWESKEEMGKLGQRFSEGLAAGLSGDEQEAQYAERKTKRATP